MMKRECAAPEGRVRKFPSPPGITAALAVALSLVAFGPGPARAEDAGSSESTLFGSMLRSLGIGGENNIEYRERPPLVVPQTRNLPPPQTQAPARAPNWPGDPKSATGKGGSQVRDLDKIPVELGPAPPPGPPVPQSTSNGGLFGKLFNSSGGTETGPIPTPSRKSLTEPPLDYEAPSPDQPYGISPPPAATPEKPATAEGAVRAPSPGGPGL